MKVVYLDHSGFLVEEKDACFLFDYYRGGIPQLSEEKTWFVFASHQHYDHYQREIFSLEERNIPVYYILSEEIRRNVEKQVLPSVKEKKRADIAGLKDRISYLRPDQELEICGCRIRSLRSTDEGVAFLVRYQGRTIYHAGDLNAWYWEEEGEKYCSAMRRDYEREIRKISGESVDIAFVPVDPRLEGEYASGLDFFMKEVSAKAVFPMHFWGEYGIYERLQKEPCTAEYADRIMHITAPGQEFFIP